MSPNRGSSSRRSPKWIGDPTEGRSPRGRLPSFSEMISEPTFAPPLMQRKTSEAVQLPPCSTFAVGPVDIESFPAHRISLHVASQEHAVFGQTGSFRGRGGCPGAWKQKSSFCRKRLRKRGRQRRELSARTATFTIASSYRRLTPSPRAADIPPSSPPEQGRLRPQSFLQAGLTRWLFRKLPSLSSLRP